MLGSYGSCYYASGTVPKYTSMWVNRKESLVKKDRQTNREGRRQADEEVGIERKTHRESKRVRQKKERESAEREMVRPSPSYSHTFFLKTSEILLLTTIPSCKMNKEPPSASDESLW